MVRNRQDTSFQEVEVVRPSRAGLVMTIIGLLVVFGAALGNAPIWLFSFAFVAGATLAFGGAYLAQKSPSQTNEARGLSEWAEHHQRELLSADIRGQEWEVLSDRKNISKVLVGNIGPQVPLENIESMLSEVMGYVGTSEHNPDDYLVVLVESPTSEEVPIQQLLESEPMTLRQAQEKLFEVAGARIEATAQEAQTERRPGVSPLKSETLDRLKRLLSSGSTPPRPGTSARAQQLPASEKFPNEGNERRQAR